MHSGILLSASAQNRSELGLSIDKATEYISKNAFSYGSAEQELEMIDSFYLYCLSVSSDDYAEALLVACFTTIPYKVVPLSLPLLKTTLYYPLPSSEDSVYLRKNVRLPRKFLFDSPSNTFGDSDKLAHFFGNASIAYRMRSNRFVLFFGTFVELFEKNFKVEGEADLRDMRINTLGVNFGYSLFAKRVLPSVYLTGYNIYNLFFYL